jgi:NAD-dependent deacetylase
MRIFPDTSIVILTGAGISAESGIRTFRDSGGLWEDHAIEDVASPEGFARNPKLVHRFYNERRAHLRTVEPNAAHQALARLEQECPGRVLVITQNVDDLHERAGSQNLLHMHGELYKVRCRSCHTVHVWREDLSVDTVCPECGRKKVLRPHIVWFGEMPLELGKIHQALSTCGMFLAIGTSGVVYPAARFIEDVSPFAYTAEINAEPSQVASSFFEHRYGKATELIPALVEELLGTCVR